MKLQNEIEEKLKQAEHLRKAQLNVWNEFGDSRPFLVNEGFIAALRWCLGQSHKDIVENAGKAIPAAFVKKIEKTIRKSMELVEDDFSYVA